MPDEKLARAIRSRIRRDILHILYYKEKVSVHEIAKNLDIFESSASKHLKLLYDLGFVNFENRPPEKFYFLKIKEIKEKRAMKKKALYPEKYPTSDWAIKNVQQEVAKKKFPKMYDKGNLMGIDRTKLQGPEFSGELKEFEGKVSDPSKVKDYRKLTSKAIEQAVRDHDLKVRRAIDLAAEQQFKGLIGDPLKESIKTELEEAGMEKEIVDKVVDKAYFDSAEASFQGILHQALDTIINFDDTSFLKLARAVRNTKVAISEEEKPLETSETPANEEEVEETPEEKVSKRRILRKRVAAIKQQIPLISGRSSSDSDEGELYKSYFNDKRVDYRNGLRN